MDRIPITREGYLTLKRELDYLKTVERPKTIKAIEEARAHGAGSASLDSIGQYSPLL